MIKSHILIIYTGGTFGMRPIDPDNPMSPLTPTHHKQLRPHLPPFGNEIGITWDFEPLYDRNGEELPPLDSSGICPERWLDLAYTIEQRYEDYDGFVILHGTDTMPYTASALSFLLVNLGKPVILTGAQRPIYFERTDAYQNMVYALYLAGHASAGLPKVTEVAVCFGDVLLRGNRTRKISTGSRQGFESPNYPPLAHLGAEIEVQRTLLREPPKSNAPFYAHRQLVTDVLDLTLFPGIQAGQLQALLSLSNLKGVVLRCYGAGNAPDDPELIEVIRESARQGTFILITTTCLEGTVDLGQYHSSSQFLQERIISGFDLTPEAALTKMMWLLGLPVPANQLPGVLQSSQRGEQTYEQVDFSVQPDPRTGSRIDILCSLNRTIDPDDLARATVRLGTKAYNETSSPSIEADLYLNLAGLHPNHPQAQKRLVTRLELPAGSDFAYASQEVTAELRQALLAQEGVTISILTQQPITVDSLELKLLLYKT